MPLNSFSSEQILPFYMAITLLLASLILWNWKKTAGLFSLFFGAFSLAYFMAALDPFFWVWDEQYHAMVGKNLSNNFLKPMLYQENPVPHDSNFWINNTVWLHKQPLFLWQIALSIKAFGPSVMAVRLPSIILFSFLPLLVYRIGKITMNPNSGFYAALLMACAYFPLELVSGFYHTDHNDISFLFYVTASFWAWFEYQNSGKKRYWLILLAIFSGFAVLTKWLMGLLVYVIWFFNHFLFNKKNRWNLKSYLPMILAGAITLMIFLPWQLYILSEFPEQAKHEFAYNSKHFFEAVEGHAGSILYHFREAADWLYGEGNGNSLNGFGWFDLLLVFGLITLLFKIDERKYIVMLLGTVFFVYLFYSIAETKMPAFTLIAMPFLLMGVGGFFDTIFERIGEKVGNKIVTAMIIICSLSYLSIDFINLDRIEMHHAENPRRKNPVRESLLRNHNFIVKFREMNLDKDYLLFNSKLALHGNIPIMFFSGNLCYEELPDKELMTDLRSKGYKIAVLNTGDLPKSILDDKQVLLINP